MGSLAFLVGLILLVAWRIDLGAVGAHLAAGAWPFLALAAVANIASAVLKSMTWQGLLNNVRGVDGRLQSLDLVSPLLVGALVNSGLPGRAGEVAKAVLARRRIARRGGGAGIAQVAGSIAAEHLVSTLAWAVIAVVVVHRLPLPLAIDAATIAVAAGCLGVTALVAWRPAPARTARGRLRRPVAALVDAWSAVHESLRGLGRPRPLAYVTAVSAGQWVAQWAAIAFTLQATGLGDAGPAAAGMVLVTLTLAHAVPLLPGGFGTFQIAAMLPLTGAYGVSPEAALSFGLLLQLGETAVSVVLGFACLVGEGVAQAQASRATAAGSSPPRLIALRNAIMSSSVLRASRSGRM
ncbi:MAG: lysylphosphatidylglycerol synthase transmembrane domain-containing protein [Thermoleophilia bacterium]